MAYKEIPVLPEMPDSKVLPVRLGIREPLGRLDNLEVMDSLVLQDSKVALGSPEMQCLVHQDPKVLLVRLVTPAKLEVEVALVFKEQLAHQGRMDLEENQEHPAMLELLVILVMQEAQVRLVKTEVLVLEDSQDQLVNRVLQVKSDH